ncbi:MAG: diaminopimelate decarboxylase [Pseudomonadales bacterium]
MSPLHRQNGQLWIDQLPLSAIASAVGTPAYVYSKQDFERRFAQLQEALAGVDAMLCYAVKANSNLSVLRTFAELGSGFDIVSGGELQRVLEAGGSAAKTIFSGVGKTIEEIDLALKHEIGCFNVESASELRRIEARAALLQRVARISIRVNPNVDAQTHPYISTGLKSNKFGVPRAEAMALYRRAHNSTVCEVVGIDCHIGSQIEHRAPLLEAMHSLLEMVDELHAEGIEVQHLDLGGGLGVTYQNESEFDVDAYGSAIRQTLGRRRLKILLEPGRYLVAGGGVLLTQVEYLKPSLEAEGHNFAIVDAAMNDLIRPALYQAWHSIEPVLQQPDSEAPSYNKHWDIVGPVCESGDFLGKGRELTLWEGALLAVCSAGAYGMVQSSNYNSRGRAAEVMVEGHEYRVIRRRETIRDQISSELEGLTAPLRSNS